MRLLTLRIVFQSTDHNVVDNDQEDKFILTLHDTGTELVLKSLNN